MADAFKLRAGLQVMSESLEFVEFENAFVYKLVGSGTTNKVMFELSLLMA